MVFDISKSENDKAQQREGLKNCPQCGSGDVRFDEISVRPYCLECKYWPPVNFGTKSDAIKKWNNAKR